MTIQNPWADDQPAIQAQNVWDDRTIVKKSTANPILGRLNHVDFRDAINQNRRNTFVLIFFMLCLSGAFGYVLGWGWDMAFNGTMTAGMQYMTTSQIDWHKLLLTPSATGIKIGVTLLSAMIVWTCVTMMRGDKVVLSMAAAREVSEHELPQLHNVVEEIAIAAGVPKPRVYLVPTRMPNAFSTGLHSDNAIVGITTGLLEQLNRDELQAVMAHEMGHIVNDDTRYATIMAVMTGILVFIAQCVLNSQRFFYYGGSYDRRGRQGSPFLFIIMIGVFLITAILVPILARIIQMAISRQREYMADATAVRLTRNPEGLISALQKIAASEEPAPRVNSAIEPLLFMAPAQMLHNGNMEWFSTHPSVESRIQRLKALE